MQSRKTPRLQTDVSDWEPLTRQDHRDLANINHIYKKTQRGEMPLHSTKSPQYGDFSGENEYDTALNFIKSAQHTFMQLPSAERRKFNNDPVEWYESTLNTASEALQEEQRLENDTKLQKAKKKAILDAKALLNIEQEIKT